MSTFNGIDVSRWQGVIDWNKVKATGVDFAFIRVGYCDYTGNVVEDIMFERNLKGAIAAGLDVGIYLYSYAKTVAAAATAAQDVLELVKDYQLAYPVAFDIEDAIYQSLGRAANTAIAHSFLTAIADGGYHPLLYTYKSFAEHNLTMSDLSNYDFWMAHITSETDYAGAYTVWQYSWTGRIDGITGDVDQNLCYKDYPSFIKANGLNGFPASEDNSTGEGAPGGDDGGDTSSVDAGTDDDIPLESAGTTYRVVKNDNLTTIAKRHGIPLRVLLHANPQITNPNLIYVGDIIHIPAKPGNN